ncbi:MAG TPA: CCA tRNA nucleotidyltransferase [Acetobacteraceae bacterium]|nr:CCA tRNA nucleotidyltransferase [Acetobacteraceae bacterium]
MVPEARIAGGAVRDWLAERPVADIDMAVPLRPEAVLRRLEEGGIRAVPTGLEHGTVTAVLDKKSFEITSLRRDVETDGRHAVVEFTDDWEADAARRDFTINAMSMDRNRRIFDYFSGQDDLRAGRVRFVGEAARRIAEDYLRILRYFRFFARYARGEPDAEAVAAISAQKQGLSLISAERIWSELKRILAAPDPRRALGLMQATSVLASVLPEGADSARFARMVERGAPAEPLLRMAALLAGDADVMASRLRLSEAERTRLAALRAAPALPPDADEAALRQALADEEPDLLIARAWLADDGKDRAGLRGRIAASPRPVFPLKGRDGLELGIAPGPALGAALAATRRWWLDGGCVADREACLSHLAGLAGISTR